MLQLPQISVLMSCYNFNSAWLKESIDSIINQSFSNFEFIIVNDGLNQKDSAILKKLSKLDNRIKLIDKKNNSGLTKSLNEAILFSKGKWIARIDADDISNKYRLERQFNFLEKNPEIIFLGCFNHNIDENGNIYGKTSFPIEHDLLVNNLLLSKKFPIHSSTIFSKEKAVEIGGYRIRYKKAQDRDLWLRLSGRGKLHCLSDYLVSYRYHKDQLSFSTKDYHQVTYAHLAIQSYFCKNNKFDDPLELNENDFDIYLKNLNNRLVNLGILKINEISREIKRKSFSKISYFFKIRFFFLFFVNNPFLIVKIILLRYFGERRSYRIFNEYKQSIEETKR